jgi:hypothetical protein
VRPLQEYPYYHVTAKNKMRTALIAVCWLVGVALSAPAGPHSSTRQSVLSHLQVTDDGDTVSLSFGDAEQFTSFSSNGTTSSQMLAPVDLTPKPPVVS